MRHQLALTLVSSLFLMATASACGQQKPTEKQVAAEEAIVRLQTQIKVGITMGDYATGIIEAELAVDKALGENQEDEYNQEMSLAVTLHKCALRFWRCDFQRNRQPLEAVPGEKCRDEALRKLFIQSPLLQETIEDLVGDSKHLSKNLDPDKVLQLIWKEATIDRNKDSGD